MLVSHFNLVIWIIFKIGISIGSSLLRDCGPIGLENGHVMSCEYQSDSIDCTSTILPELTVAVRRCDELWHQKSESVSSLLTSKQVCVNGSWVGDSRGGVTCTPKCGLWLKTDEAIIMESNPVFPWIVGIHTRIGSRFQYGCQGTLISPRAILTAASCVTLENSTIERRPNDVKISLKPHSSPELPVEKIVLHPDFIRTKDSNNLAIIWLKTPQKLTKTLTPACLFKVDEAKEGIIAILKMTETYQTSGKLINCTTPPIGDSEIGGGFCAVISNPEETDDCNGSGLYTIQAEIGIWSLRGIRSRVSKNCRALIFTEVTSLKKMWIDKELGREPPIYEPRSPESTLVKNQPIGQQHQEVAGPISQTTDSITPAANRNGILNLFYPVIPTRFPISTPRSRVTSTTVKSTATPNVVVDPGDDTYSLSGPPSGKCPPLGNPGPGIIQTCKSDIDELTDCSRGGDIGTLAISRCADYHVSSFGPDLVKRHCLADGQWSTQRPLRCHLECGIATRPKKSFIVNGIPSDRISWPWHATLFKKVGHDIQYICGGTLISKSVVLTAAHCLTRAGTSTLADESEFRVVFASLSSNYTQNLLDPLSKSNLFHVKSIFIPDSFNGVTFDSDIGLVQLEFEVELSDYVKPVCFPFQTKENEDIEQLQLSPGTLGQTVGFGIDETGKPSIRLKEASLPVVSHRDCHQVLERLPSSTQFCAGYLNGTAVCNGDSGSGLYFSDGTGFTNRYIIQGIVSFGDASSDSNFKTCNPDTFAVFTKVSSFSSWVELKLENVESTM